MVPLILSYRKDCCLLGTIAVTVQLVVVIMLHNRAVEGRAGDMALSIIDELPPGRSPIVTARVFSKEPDTVAQARTLWA